jgi:hypothetical protein
VYRSNDRCRAFFLQKKSKHLSLHIETKKFGVPKGIRTPVTAVKGRCPNRWTMGTTSLLLSSMAQLSSKGRSKLVFFQLSKVVGRPRLELGTIGLKVRCSTN